MKVARIFLAILVSLLIFNTLGAVLTSGQDKPSPWPRIQANNQSTGLSQYNASSNRGELVWRFFGPGPTSSPVIGPDDTIYFTVDQQGLKALTPDGGLKWIYKSSGRVFNAPTVGNNGTIYVSDDGGLYSISDQGDLNWKFQNNVATHSPTIGSDGTIYFSSWDSYLYAVNPNGGLVWKFKHEGDAQVNTPPSVDRNGTIYIGTQGASNSNPPPFYLVAVFPNGTMKWEFTTPAGVYTPPAIDGNGNIFVGLDNSDIYSLTPDGVLRWKYTVDNNKTDEIIYKNGLSIGKDGTVYTGAGDQLLAINNNGTLKWKRLLHGDVQTPVISNDGTIFVGVMQSYFYALDLSGNIKWTFSFYNGWEGALNYPAIGRDGTIYTAVQDNEMDTYTSVHLSEVYAIGNRTDVTPLPERPNTPKNITLTQKSGSTDLTWDPVDNVVDPPLEGNYIHFLRDGDEFWNTYSALSNATSFHFDDLLVNESYSLFMNGYSRFGESPPSEIVHFRTLDNASHWPMFMHDRGHTGLSDIDTTQNTGDLLWEHHVDYDLSGSQAGASAVIGTRDRLFLGSPDYVVHSLNKNGTERGITEESRTTNTTVTTSSNLIYFSSTNDQSKSKVYMFEGDLGHFPSTTFITYGSPGAPTVGPDGTVYVSTNKGILYSLAPRTLEKNWEITLSNGAATTDPAISDTGMVYIAVRGQQNSTLYAVTGNGTVQWHVPLGGAITSAPSISPDNTIYVGSSNGKVYAISSAGRTKWSYTTGDAIVTTPGIGPKGNIVVGSKDGSVYSLDNGTLLWRYKTGGPITSSAAQGSEGTVYIGSGDHYVYAIYGNGALKWKFKTNGSVVGSPAISSNGTVFINSLDSNYYALGRDPSIAPPTNNTQNTKPPIKPPTHTPPVRIKGPELVRRETVAVVIMPILLIPIIATVALKTEAGLYFTHSAMMGLYSRKKMEEILDNFIRGQLYGHIYENPGLTFTELKERISRPNGTVVFHLKAMEREGLIRSVRQGIHRLFFPGNMKIKEEFFELLEPERAVYKMVKLHPGISQVELSNRTGIPPTTVNRYIHHLREKGLMTIQRGKKTQCFVKD